MERLPVAHLRSIDASGRGHSTHKLNILPYRQSTLVSVVRLVALGSKVPRVRFDQLNDTVDIPAPPAQIVRTSHTCLIISKGAA
jgi:hypothetical protein